MFLPIIIGWKFAHFDLHVFEFTFKPFRKPLKWMLFNLNLKMVYCIDLEKHGRLISQSLKSCKIIRHSFLNDLDLCLNDVV